MGSAIEVRDVWKTYELGEHGVHALRGVSMRIDAGEFVALLGPSGSGKSSLLHILGAMDRPSAGTVRLEGEEISALPAARQTALRLRRIGFVFQTFNLMPTLTALENVALPMRLAGVVGRRRSERAADLLERVGLADRAGQLPRQLSGGQRQSVAIAPALANDPSLILANDPSLILADEPTGNLDSESGEFVLEILKTLHAGRATIVMVTHNPEMARYAERTITMRDGRLKESRPPVSDTTDEPQSPAPRSPNSARSLATAHVRAVDFREGLLQDVHDLA